MDIDHFLCIRVMGVQLYCYAWSIGGACILFWWKLTDKERDRLRLTPYFNEKCRQSVGWKVFDFTCFVLAGGFVGALTKPSNAFAALASGFACMSLVKSKER
jgi:hypothetical protein